MVVVKGDINSIQRCVDNYVKVVSKKRIVDSEEEVSFSDPSFSLGLCSSISEDEKNCLEDEIITVEEEKCDLELEGDEFITYSSYSENENNYSVNEKEVIENEDIELDKENTNLVNESEITELGDCEDYCELEDDEFIDYSNGVSSEEEDDEFIDYSSGVSSDDVDDFINYEGFVTEEEVVEDYSSEEEGFSWGSYEEGEEVEWENPLVDEEVEEEVLWENPLVDEDEEEEVYDEVGWDYTLASVETEEEHDEEVLWENPLVDEEEVLWDSPLVDEEEEEVLWGNPFIAEEVHESSSLDKEEVKEEEINEVEEIQVPKDLRDFVKMYNNCEMSFALEYFSKKEIDKQLSLGRVFKRKNRLLI